MYVYGTPSSTLHGRDTKNVAAYVTKAFNMVAICLLPTISFMILVGCIRRQRCQCYEDPSIGKLGSAKKPNKNRKKNQQRKWPTCLTKLCGPIRPLLPPEPTGNLRNHGLTTILPASLIRSEYVVHSCPIIYHISVTWVTCIQWLGDSTVVKVRGRYLTTQTFSQDVVL